MLWFMDFSNSDGVPVNGITMKLNHEKRLKGRYFVLKPGDIVAGKMDAMRHHPGNVLFELSVGIRFADWFGNNRRFWPRFMLKSK